MTNTVLVVPGQSADISPHFEVGATGHMGFYVNGILCAGWTRALDDREQYEVRLLYRGHYQLRPSSPDIAVPSLRDGLVTYWQFNEQ